ncbi:glycosyltransferase family 25 protein [Isoalcanivorax indicus]|uniref:glycosyltransferase family 25 protein n=1 Tax=Isoalcanivorax indicus TaxID=2202653 RepID=UPI000DB9A757|nr:glycosyltransferase family 25 protein [Isoalcanivorax indicus]
MTIYLVSLDKDTARRDVFRERFPETWPHTVHLSAVDGRKLDAGSYFKYVTASLREGRGLMSPAEVGCSLSHIAALEAFLASDARHALVLEDDILGNDMDIQHLADLAERLDDNDILICGGQEGLSHRKYQFGKRNNSQEPYILAPFSYRYMFRTCCYIVGRPAAERIIATQKRALRVADDWGAFFSNTSIRMLLSNTLAHPEDLSTSLIEAERIDMSQSREKKTRSLTDRVRNRASRIARKIRILRLLLQGYRPAR